MTSSSGSTAQWVPRPRWKDLVCWSLSGWRGGGARRGRGGKAASRQAPTRPAEVLLFVSYSHKDDYWMQALMPLLKFPGVRVKPWNDEEIRPGVRWDKEIKEPSDEDGCLHAAGISALRGITRHSANCEEAMTMTRSKLMPVLVGDPGKDECAWLMALRRVPLGKKSWEEVLHDFQQYDCALAPIRDGIKAVVECARKRRDGGSVRAIVDGSQTRVRISLCVQSTAQWHDALDVARRRITKNMLRSFVAKRVALRKLLPSVRSRKGH